MRCLKFTKRNFLELIRDPLASVFFLAFPGVLFLVLSLIIRSMGEEALIATPQFEITHLTMSMIVFSFSFITIFVANIIATDRESFFLMRLKASPMRALDFVIGYTLSILPIAVLQEIVMLLVGLCLGLKFTGFVLLGALILLPVSLLFIGLGILFGTIVNSKAVGGIASIVPTFASLIGGMFFPLDKMEGGFKTICYIFPFANAIKVGNLVVNNNFNILTEVLIVLAYTLGIYILSVAIFQYKLHSDSLE